MSENSDSAYYKLATDAAGRGEYDHAKDICLNAIKQFEHVGKDRKTAEAFHLLGTIAYRQGELTDAESWYRRALAIDNQTGDDRGAARTCNNLGTVANARGEYDAAVEWLWKSIHIKERLADEAGLAASYHQLGIVAQTRLDFDAAEEWYLRSLEIEEKQNSAVGVAKTSLNLCEVAEARGNNDSAERWRQKALQALGRKRDVAVAVNLGKEAEHDRKYGLAQTLYKKALDIAKEHADDEGQSVSYLYLGHLACGMGDYRCAKDHYEKSVEIDERLHEMDRAASSCRSLGNICLSKANGGERDFRSARRWFRKSLALNKSATWQDWLVIYARLWRYRLLGFVLNK